MRCDFFTIPINDPTASEVDRLNKLLSSARILTVDRHFVADGANSFWSICVQSQAPSQRPAGAEKKPPIDYREVLSPEAFGIYVRLRALRKTIAAEDAVPPYSVFTNEQLAEMVRQPVRSLRDLKAINGVGPSRVEKYGARFLEELEVTCDAT